MDTPANKPDNENAQANIPPVQLGKNSTFKFRCHPGVKCFTRCCRGIDILLTPYDIIRLKNRLELDSETFLAMYTEPHILEKTDLPVITLKMIPEEGADENAEKACPFVRPDGCIVYQDRPTTCRYYPLGVATLNYQEKDDDGFFFFINEPHCLGFESDTEWTVAKWRQDQGVDIHDEINAAWTDLLVRKRSFPPNVKLTDQAKQMFFMVSYNIDKFRKFVFESTFLSRFEVDAQQAEKMKTDDVALLEFGVHWLTERLFKKSNLQAEAGPVIQQQMGAKNE